MGEELTHLLLYGLPPHIRSMSIGHELEYDVFREKVAARSKIPVCPFGVDGSQSVDILLRHCLLP